MKTGSWKVFLALGLLLTGTAAGARGAELPEFSAQMVMQGAEGSFTGMIYSAGDRMRYEMPGSVVITRMDLNVSWMLMPAENMYMEQPVDPNVKSRTYKKLPDEVERVLIGPDTVSGRDAEKYRVSYLENGETRSIYQWVSGDLPLPLRVAALDDSWWVEYRDIRMGAQPDTLFEVPPGYQKFAMPDLSQFAQQMAAAQDSE